MRNHGALIKDSLKQDFKKHINSMKPLYLLAFALLLSGAVRGQTKPLDTIKWVPGTNEVMASDPLDEIFSIRYTGDPKLLKPLDASYSAENNVAYQSIRYYFNLNKKDMLLIIKNYYDGKYWMFRSLTIQPYFKFATSSPLYNGYFSPNLNAQ